MLSKPREIKIGDLSKAAVCFQPKLNGIRCYWDGCELRTRNGRPVTCLDHIKKEIKAEGLEHVPFDGELFTDAYQFETLNGLIRRKKANEKHKAIKYHVFDLIAEEDQISRLHELERLPDLQHVKPVKARFAGDAETRYNEFLAQGFEGLIARELSAPYGKGVYKIKPIFDAEFTVKEVGPFWLILEAENGKTFKLEKDNHGLKKGDRATVEFSQRTRNGLPFQPRLKAQRWDLPKEDKKEDVQKKEGKKEKDWETAGVFLVYAFSAIFYVLAAMIIACFMLINRR